MDLQKRFILAGNFIDGTGADVRRNIFLEVKEGIITGIGPAEEMVRKKKEGAAIDDFNYCTIVPALIDCSISLTRSPAVDSRVRLAIAKAGPAKQSALVTQHIRYCHSHGVLGVAANDDKKLDRLKLFQKIIPNKPSIEIRKSGSDFLRIVYAGIINNEEAPGTRLNQEDLYRILQQKGEKKAVVLANGPERVKEALAAGCDAIEQGYAMGEDNLQEMAKKNVLWIPSVLIAKNGLLGSGSGGDVMCRFSMRYVAPGKGNPVAETFWKKMLAEQLAQLRLAKKLGVKTVMGTGAGSVGILHGESVVEEMKLFIKAGYSLEETIHCASDIGAGFFGIGNLGSLTVGRKATFLITRGTVQQLPRKLAYLECIYIEGVPYKN